MTTTELREWCDDIDTHTALSNIELRAASKIMRAAARIIERNEDAAWHNLQKSIHETEGTK